MNTFSGQNSNFGFDYGPKCNQFKASLWDLDGIDWVGEKKDDSENWIILFSGLAVVRIEDNYKTNTFTWNKMSFGVNAGGNEICGKTAHITMQKSAWQNTYTHNARVTHYTRECLQKQYIYYKSRSHGRPFCFGSFFMLAVSIILCTYTQMYWLCTSYCNSSVLQAISFTYICCVCVCVYMGGWIRQKET